MSITLIASIATTQNPTLTVTGFSTNKIFINDYQLKLSIKKVPSALNLCTMTHSHLPTTVPPPPPLSVHLLILSVIVSESP